jgi:hypothetical protein
MEAQLDSDQENIAIEALYRLLEGYSALGSRVIALETVCAKMLQEVALLSATPSERMVKLTSEIRGMGDAIAQGTSQLAALEGFDPSELTRALERLCEMAEADFLLK